MSDSATEPATRRKALGGSLGRTVETALVPAESPTQLAAQSSADMPSVTATHRPTVDAARLTTEQATVKLPNNTTHIETNAAALK